MSALASPTQLQRSGLERTVFALVASGLSAIPLCTLLSDRGWLLDVWFSMLVVLLPALLLRVRRPPGALQVWPGVVLLVPWLTRRFLSDTAVYGFIPTTRTWHRISTLLDDLHYTAQHEVAPVHSTVAITLAVCTLLALLAALIDLIAVVGRHGALAGVPLLIVYTVAGAVPHRSVSWALFLAPAAGFLLLLALDARDDRLRWGHRVGRPGHAITQPPVALAGQRIAVLALLVAVLLPFATPAGGTNLVSLLLRHTSSHGSGGIGSGSISPFAALKGQLTRTTPLDLMQVRITDDTHGAAPFYLRENVLPNYTAAGWGPAASHGPANGVDSDPGLTNDPPFGDSASQQFTAQVSVLGLSGNPPVFALPAAIDGLDDADWSSQDQLLLGTSVHSGQRYTESVAQPQPSIADLRAAADVWQDPSMVQWTKLPTIPAMVRTLVHTVISGADTPYARARAINDYFTNPANGFQYSLQTVQGDSGSDLVDFLTNKTGFCQQYAAAMAVMLRLAEVPARVVLGYTHGVTSATGTFTVTTNDAHAWVEAYFGGIGWVPFDPTPVTGEPGAATTTLPWAPPYSQPGDGSSSAATTPTAHPSAHRPTAGEHSTAPGASGAGTSGTGAPGWLAPVLVVAAVAVLLLTPWFVRTRRRRRRLRAAADGDPDPLWAELSDTAVDLGYVWSPTRTPRQVVRWLGDATGEARGALAALAQAVEQHRYAAPGTDGGTDGGADLRDELATVTARLRAERDRTTRLRAALWPASLRWLRRGGPPRRRR